MRSYLIQLKSLKTKTIENKPTTAAAAKKKIQVFDGVFIADKLQIHNEKHNIDIEKPIESPFFTIPIFGCVGECGRVLHSYLI